MTNREAPPVQVPAIVAPVNRHLSVTDIERSIAFSPKARTCKANRSATPGASAIFK